MANVNIFDMTDTWNDGATTFTAIKMNVTNTASANGSKLLDLQVGGTSKAVLKKDGAIATGSYSSADSGYFDVHTSNSAAITGSTSSVKVRLKATAVGDGPYISIASDGFLGIASGVSALSNSPDVQLWRDAADTLALRRSTNAQTFNVYSSYTDASNYTRGALKAASGVVTLAAESAGTGDANIDVTITPKGTGRLRYGTHSAIGAETVTGYIEVKDSGGTTRKLAVVS